MIIRSKIHGKARLTVFFLFTRGLLILLLYVFVRSDVDNLIVINIIASAYREIVKTSLLARHQHSSPS